MAEDPHPLKLWRLRHHLTQDALAMRVGVTGPQISMIEARKRGASVSVAARIARLAGGEVPFESLTRPRALEAAE